MRSFASPVRHYLPDAPPMVLGPFFKSDCVEDDRRLQEWYFTHADRLHWASVSKRFRVSQSD